MSKTVVFDVDAGLWPDINRDFNIPEVSILILTELFYDTSLTL